MIVLYRGICLASSEKEAFMSPHQRKATEADMNIELFTTIAQ
ncbi:hypothetical protein LA76x_0418 [Lysobacter antibioticus]|uniref:Uncharacterized protein n=1 Tax=Lysobacter antibioticus TaxID=84531 RepID=A0A0S2F4W4_LYSAN|nr:hypothetical protein LA76x_0418 [Lysobacter antibioticus]